MCVKVTIQSITQITNSNDFSKISFSNLIKFFMTIYENSLTLVMGLVHNDTFTDQKSMIFKTKVALSSDFYYILQISHSK